MRKSRAWNIKPWKPKSASMKATYKMLRFSLRKISASLLIFILCGFIVPEAFAVSMNITPDYVQYAFLPKVETLSQSPEYSRPFEFDQKEYVKEEGYMKITSLDVNAYNFSERSRNAESADFKKLLSVKAEDENPGNFVLLEAGKKNSNYQMDNLSLKRKSKYDLISESTNYMAFLHIAAAGLLYLMPESVTNWDKSTMSLSTVTDKWVRDVKSGPVWDKDDWVINYIGHPYQGAAYYVFARQSGYEWKGAFLFSTIISTFMWEYGFESFGEVPSTQDLIVTPIAGSILGEILLNGGKRIAENDGKVLGSRVLGNISLVLIDPAGSAVKALQKFTNAPSRIKTRTEVFYEPSSMYNSRDKAGPLSDANSQYGLRVVFTYN
jgi:hypothetical protein